MIAPAPRRGLVIGCGGTLGFAWSAVILAELGRQLNWDARTADVLVGTSAGAEMAAMLGSGRSTQAVLDALHGAPDADPVLIEHLARHPGKTPPPPRLSWPGLGLTRAAATSRGAPYTALAGLLPRGRGDAGWLRDLGERLAGPDGWVGHPATWLMALDARTGERVAYGSDAAPSVPLGEAIAASWAIPGWFGPVRVAGRDVLDGGTASSTSADLVAPLGLDEVVIVAPMTSHGGQPGRGLARVERLLRRQMTSVVDREHQLLVEAGVRVIRIEPGPPELEAMGFNFMDLIRRPATLATTRLHAARRVADALSASDQSPSTAKAFS